MPNESTEKKSVNNEKNSIDKQLSDFGISAKDVNDISRDAQNAYKMVFEQVLLVMIYVRLLLKNQRLSVDIANRMELIHGLFSIEQNSDELRAIQSHVLNLLELDKGSNDIIFYLQNLNTDISKSLLNKIQEGKVAFAPIYVRRVEMKKKYSYYQMYICLQNPVQLFEILLNQEIHDKDSIEKLLLSKLETTKDKSILLKTVRKSLAENLGDWANRIFARISNPNFSSQYNKSILDFRKNFSKFYEIDTNGDKVTLVANQKLVKSLHQLNQLDDFFDSMKLALMAKFESENRSRGTVIESFINNENALAELSSWYSRYGTDLLSKIDKIPKSIITILEFDLINSSPSLNQSLFDAEALKFAYEEADKKFNAFRKKYTKAKEIIVKSKFIEYIGHRDIHEFLFGLQPVTQKRAKLSPVRARNEILTYLVTTNLYMHKRLEPASNIWNFDEFLFMVKNRQAYKLIKNEINDWGYSNRKYNDIKHLSLLSNRIMESWTVFKENDDGTLDATFNLSEQDKMTYRFKTVPIFFKKDVATELFELNSKIESQSSIDNPKPFPYNSAFPCPLWLEYLSDKEESSI